MMAFSPSRCSRIVCIQYSQEAQLTQTDRATRHVIEYFTKSRKNTQGKMTLLSRACKSLFIETMFVCRSVSEILSDKKMAWPWNGGRGGSRSLKMAAFDRLIRLSIGWPDDCHLLADTGRRQLRSSDVATCSVLRTHSSLGDRCFAVAGPRTCNSLPIKLWQPDLSLEQFRRLLKTHLFS